MYTGHFLGKITAYEQWDFHKPNLSLLIVTEIAVLIFQLKIIFQGNENRFNSSALKAKKHK